MGSRDPRAGGRRRGRPGWGVFLAAMAGSLLLATGFGLAVTRVSAAQGPAPRLHTVPPGTLSSAGLTLSPAQQPPYCAVQRGAADRGLGIGGGAGCAISQHDAEADARRSGQG